MPSNKQITKLTFAFMLALSVGATTPAHAAKNDCQKAFKKLSSKVVHLEAVARQRKAEKNLYGYRRLTSIARVVKTHISNLPCANSHLCLP